MKADERSNKKRAGISSMPSFTDKISVVVYTKSGARTSVMVARSFIST